MSEQKIRLQVAYNTSGEVAVKRLKEGEWDHAWCQQQISNGLVSTGMWEGTEEQISYSLNQLLSSSGVCGQSLN